MREKLIKKAIEAAEFAYVPYSHFHVGAALLCKDGSIYTGCNIENASYSLVNCAERTAIFKAVSEGKKEFESIVIHGYLEGSEEMEYAYPCGACRQVMSEFAGRDFEVIMANSVDDYKITTLAELLPYSFKL